MPNHNKMSAVDIEHLGAFLTQQRLSGILVYAVVVGAALAFLMLFLKYLLPLTPVARKKLVDMMAADYMHICPSDGADPACECDACVRLRSGDARAKWVQDALFKQASHERENLKTRGIYLSQPKYNSFRWSARRLSGMDGFTNQLMSTIRKQQ